MERLSKLLRQLRGNESLRDVAKRAGISHSYLSHLEKGVDPRTGKPLKPSADTLKGLARAYNYPYEKLLEAADYISPGTIAAHRSDDSTQALPPEARRALKEFQAYIFRKHGLTPPDEEE